MIEMAFAALNYALAHLVLSAGALLVVLALGRVRALGAETRAALLLAALILPAAIPLLPASMTDSQLERHTPATEHLASLSAEAVFAEPVSNAPPSRDGQLALPPALALMLVGLWLAGTGWRLMKLGVGAKRVRDLIAAAPCADALRQAYSDVVPASTQVRLTRSFGPAVAGIVRPTILIPEAMATNLPPSALRAVLLHEQSHVARGDVANHWLQRLLEAGFWWNPLLLAIAARTQTAREVACDVRAARHCRSAADYAESLLEAIEQVAHIPRHAGLPALAMASAPHQLDERIDALLTTPRAMGAAGRVLMLAVLIGVVSLGFAAPVDALRLTPAEAAESALAAPALDRAWQRKHAELEIAHQRESLRLHEAAQREDARLRQEAEREDARQRAAAEREDARQREEAQVEDTRQREEAAREDAQQRAEAEHEDARQREEAERWRAWLHNKAETQDTKS